MDLAYIDRKELVRKEGFYFKRNGMAIAEVDFLLPAGDDQTEMDIQTFTTNVGLTPHSSISIRTHTSRTLSSQVVSHPITILAQCGLTSVFESELAS